ncbi:MAG: GNAT family N-acetyltransferase [Clostridia bacterium]|nr:GNAT family N-acetyltransferase [Clostridia bacterium]
MKKVELYVPSIEEFGFRQELLSDPNTMEYNKGEKVSYMGYHYDTGCIDFPKERWKDFEEKMKNPNFFYAYIKDLDTQEFVGEISFKLDSSIGKANLGIIIKADKRGQGYMKPSIKLLIKEARMRKIKFLADSVSASREAALHNFYKLGFKKINEYKITKNGILDTIAAIEMKL